MEQEINDPDDAFPPDPVARPVEQAARAMAKCHAPIDDPDLPDLMLRELRAAMVELMPGSMFRTSDTRLAAQSAVLDAMFYRSAESAIRAYKNKDGTDSIYLDESRTALTLKIQNQYRRTVEGLKSDYAETERLSLARMRLQRNSKKT
jgi:hypothetical protein